MCLRKKADHVKKTSICTNGNGLFKRCFFLCRMLRTRKPLLFIAVSLGLLLAACTKEPVAPVAPEIPVAKTIAFNVYAAKDYSDAFYDNALAEVRLSVGKISLKENTTQIVWDTTYSFRPFKAYPLAAQMIHIEKLIPHYENSEVLQASTVVRYNVGGHPSMEAKGDPVQRNERYKLMTVAF